jgi:Na+-transporting methylmalonyl-CoA/oxaloacetate decarboxylase gamma subunit
LALLAVAGVIVFYFLSLLFTRVWYESVIIRFQMAEDIREIRKKYLA